MKYLFLFFLSFLNFLFCSSNKYDSNQIVSVDTYKTLANFIWDQKTTFNPEKVYEGSVVFIKNDYLQTFFEKLFPKIDSRFILITHDSDGAAPREFISYLENEKVIAWLGQNPSIVRHEKFHPIPIGVAGRKWKHGNISLIKQSLNSKLEKKYLAYLNIAVHTYPKERQKVQNLFLNQSYCLSRNKCPFQTYLKDLKESYFVFSPRGNGLDCHRTWEAILMGTIPILSTSNLDPLLEDLPVLVVNNWNEVNEEMLLKKWKEFQDRDFNLDKLYIPYWRRYISNLLDKESLY